MTISTHQSPTYLSPLTPYVCAGDLWESVTDLVDQVSKERQATSWAIVFCVKVICIGILGRWLWSSTLSKGLHSIAVICFQIVISTINCLFSNLLGFHSSLWIWLSNQFSGFEFRGLYLSHLLPLKVLLYFVGSGLDI